MVGEGARLWAKLNGIIVLETIKEANEVVLPHVATLELFLFLIETFVSSFFMKGGKSYFYYDVVDGD